MNFEHVAFTVKIPQRNMMERDKRQIDMMIIDNAVRSLAKELIKNDLINVEKVWT